MIEKTARCLEAGVENLCEASFRYEGLGYPAEAGRRLCHLRGEERIPPSRNLRRDLLIDSWESQEAIDAHHHTPMMQKIMELREKYDLHRKVLRFVAEDVPSKLNSICRFSASNPISLTQVDGREMLRCTTDMQISHFSDGDSLGWRFFRKSPSAVPRRWAAEGDYCALLLPDTHQRVWQLSLWGDFYIMGMLSNS